MINIETQPSFTYKLDFTNDKTVGNTDDLTAIKQAIYKILNTERYLYPIYSSNFGIELKDLYGLPTDFVILELETRISEALLQDDRISEVNSFEFTVNDGVITASFTVSTIFGDTNESMEVNY